MDEGMVTEAHGIEEGNGVQQAHSFCRLTGDDILDSGSESTGTTDRGSNQPEATPTHTTKR